MAKAKPTIKAAQASEYTYSASHEMSDATNKTRAVMPQAK